MVIRPGNSIPVDGIVEIVLPLAAGVFYPFVLSAAPAVAAIPGADPTAAT